MPDQFASCEKYLTLVYQIDLGMTRLLWVRKERTIQSFQGFFTAIGDEVISRIAFVCSDSGSRILRVSAKSARKRSISSTASSSQRDFFKIGSHPSRCTRRLSAKRTSSSALFIFAAMCVGFGGKRHHGQDCQLNTG